MLDQKNFKSFLIVVLKCNNSEILKLVIEAEKTKNPELYEDSFYNYYLENKLDFKYFSKENDGYEYLTLSKNGFTCQYKNVRFG